MQTKLTLRMEQELIEAAKDYAGARGTSVSQLVANYFRTLLKREPQPDDWKASLPPITRRFAEREPPAVQPTEEDYYRYLEEKHSKHLRGTNS